MKLFVAFATCLSICVQASSSLAGTDAATLAPKSGFVRYEVHLKTLGVGGDDVAAVNRSCIGKFSVSADGRVEGGLIVPVVGFDSNNTKRDKDVAKILKYKEHPAITFEVVGMTVEDIERVLGTDSGQVNLKARISAAGGSKVYDVAVAYRAAGSGSIRFTTAIDAKFTDFGINPPRLGLILKTAPDQIKLSGDLVFDVKRGIKNEP
jgi:hypothetical protein